MVTFFRKNIGLLSILTLVFLPLARWVALPGWDFRFIDLNTTITSFGQMAGLVGVVLFSLVLILGGRFKFLDKYFYGINRAYAFHHKIGAVAFSLLLFHPLFLAVKYINFSLLDAALFLLPSSNLAIDYGLVALVLMMILIGLTFYARMKYQNWKFFHKFMVLVFIFAIGHSFFITSDISRDIILRIYILGLAAVGLSVGFCQVVFSRSINRNFKYIIKKVISLNNNVMAIEMEPGGRAIKFVPGQFVFVSFTSRGINPEIHPFSISSAPREKTLQLVIKSLGDFTSELKKLQVGEAAVLEGPFGKFSYQNITNRNQIWIAGGVGVTPFVSMAKSLSDPSFKIDMYYSVANKEEAVLLTDLFKIATVNKNFKIIPWYSSEKSYIDAKAISGLSGGLDNKDILLCGPPVFMKALRKQFIELKISRQRIHWEKFNFI
jgi:predicted ferric reductase